MRSKLILAAALLWPAAHALADGATPDIERGRFLVVYGGCNDCHTPGYAEQAGKLPESAWLTGSPVGFQGPWGTSYPGNLRLDFARWSEQEWIAAARAPRMPPMPWFNLVVLSDDDLRAIYRYMRSLGPAGDPAPAYVAPGGRVTTPVIVFVPQPPAPAVAAKVATAGR